MKIKTVPITWVIEEDHRFDCGPFTRGGIEAKKILESLNVPKFKLVELVLGGMAGLYHVGMDKLRWVDDAGYGVPFLRSADILRADLSNQSCISRTQVLGNPLFTCPVGTTLITRSGTIGRMAYCREDMAGMAMSQDVLKVVPDQAKIASGYLYAFLSSKYGVPLIISGTFGSIIVHIEGENIANLPVPRLGDDIEKRAHKLIQQAAEKRSQAAEFRKLVVTKVTTDLRWTPRVASDLWMAVGSSTLQRRLDAFHYGAGIAAARKCLASPPSVRLGDVVVEVFEPNRGARRKVDDPAYGIEFLSSAEVFRLDPVGDYLISRTRTPHIERHLIGETDLLLPRSGQLGGIIGRAVLPLPSNYGSAASEHLVRVRCKSREDAFFAWAIFATQPGYYAAIGTAYGSSIPSLDCELLADLHVPWWEGTRRKEIVTLVEAMVDALSDAISMERAGVALVERAIEEAS